MSQAISATEAKPLENLDEWEDFLKERYPETSLVGSNPDKKEDQFRDYENTARPTVREFYRLNHAHQSFDFVQEKRREFLDKKRRDMSVWEALEFLNTLVDDSDPDTDLSQLEHLLQTAEQIRKDGHPRWFILTGLIHDLGKLLCLFGEPQWAVVGDTFPVGCAYSDKIVFHKFFETNPDFQNPEFQTKLGIYEQGKGLDSVTMSWGHDEYLYQITKDFLPPEALYMIRYHSFYPAHRDGAYHYLMNDQDRRMFDWVRKFNPYDLYTKSHTRPNLKELRPFYDDLINEYLPPVLQW
ncbi:MAG: inositol oxygenase family protein [Verrucomicrobiota bacterium]